MMVGTYITLMALSLLALPAAANSETCDQEAARVKMETAAAAGIVLDLNFFNDMPTIVIDPATWAGMNIDTRLGLFDVFECLVAGPSSTLAEAQAVDPGGKQLATFDGISRRMNVN